MASEAVRIGERSISRPLYLIFLSEADELIQTLADDTAQWRSQPVREASEAAMRAVHSLSGSASVVELEPVHGLAEALERVYSAQRLQRCASGRGRHRHDQPGGRANPRDAAPVRRWNLAR